MSDRSSLEPFQSNLGDEYNAVFQDELVANIFSEVTIPNPSSEDSTDKVDIAPITSQFSLYDEIYRSFEDENADVLLTHSTSDSIDDILKYLSDEDLCCAINN